MDRDDRLDLENVLSPLVRPDVEIRVVRERHADQITDRVLQFLGNLCRIVVSRMAWG